MGPICIVLPTYNEVENLPLMIEAIEEQLDGLEWKILVVDDNSPDGTGKLADSLTENSRVEVLHRKKKEGLGIAYLEGFQKALDQGADLIIQMDVDFSHDPRDLYTLIEGTHYADLVIGSRYTTGGQIKDWSLTRRLVSRAGSFYLKTLLRVPVNDMTAGFKLWKREALEKVLPELSFKGFGFQAEANYLAHRAGFEIIEIPVCFKERELGISKMSFRITLEALKIPWVLFKRGKLSRTSKLG